MLHDDIHGVDYPQMIICMYSAWVSISLNGFQFSELKLLCKLCPTLNVLLFMLLGVYLKDYKLPNKFYFII